VQSEQKLLAGIRQLDNEALTEVHNLYYPAIFRYIAFRVGSHENAEDLTSEVFIRLLNAVNERSAPSRTLRGWLYGVASRIVADFHRQRFREERLKMETQENNELSDPATAVSQKQTLKELSTALNELTKEQQEVIALRFGSGMPIRQVAEAIGKSEGAVKQLQARAVAKLSDLMTPGRSG
jgi:RNA polymerase sigma-70 factor (ECF subfamily)